MARNPNDRRQQTLPLAEAEGTHAERRNHVAIALACVRADLHLAKLMFMIFETTGGTGEDYKKTYSEMGHTPNGLCCGRTKVMKTIGEAIGYGWLKKEQTTFASGGDAANVYDFDWKAIKATADLSRGRLSAHAVVRQPGAVVRHPDAAVRHALKDSYSLSINSSSPQGPLATPFVAEDWEAVAVELKEAKYSLADALIGEAYGNGFSPPELSEVVGTYRANASKFRSPGAIAFYVRTRQWPTSEETTDPAAKAAREAFADAQQRKRAAEAAQQRDQLRVENEIIAERETAYGSALDAMDAAELDKLIESLEPGLQASVRASPRSRLVRPLLLEALEAVRTEALTQ